MLAEHVGAQQQPGGAVGPQPIAVAAGVAGLDDEDVGVVAGDALETVASNVVPLRDAIVAGLQQGRKRAQHAALLDHRDVAARPERVDDVVVAKDLALAAVERLDALVLVRAFAEMGDARARHDAAAADDEGALEVAPAGRVVDAQQP